VRTAGGDAPVVWDGCSSLVVLADLGVEPKVAKTRMVRQEVEAGV
jgi:hypothetical protein